MALKRRGPKRSAKLAKALLIGSGAAVTLNNAIVSTSTHPTSHLPLLTTVEAASSPSTSIRGGGNTASYNESLSNKRLGNTPRRPAIVDSHQSEKIEQWRAVQQQQQLGSSNGDTTARQLSASSSLSNNNNVEHNKSQALFNNSVLPQVTTTGKRRLYDYMSLNHKKKSGSSSSSSTHVTKLDDDKFHFQTVPPSTTTTTTTKATTTTTSTKAASMIVANSQNSNNSNNNYYYPISTPDHTVGTCTNNGNEPQHYTLSNHFLFTSLEECCNEWFVKAGDCQEGFATTSSLREELLLRDPFTGASLLDDESGGMESNSASSSNSNSDVYYPSFDMETYPNGACLNDGQQPEIYNTQEGYTFSNIGLCCHDWFVDEAGCERASVEVLEGGGEEPVPSPSAVEETDWPTWSSEYDYDDDDDDVDTDIQETSSQGEEESLSELTFYESFESGDFSQNDWRLTSSSATTDLWEADQSAWAYDGVYAARAGVLSVPNTQTNLTISLEDLQAIQHGGYLTFAIHASVSKPVDELTFSINDNVIRKFEEVTGDEGDWEEVSVLLHAGEHRLTWSYHYFGGTLSSNSNVDPRRVGNTWVDAIVLRPFTGDVNLDDDDDTTLSMTGGMTPFKLISDVEAFSGSKSYVAKTEDIDASQGSAEMSWDVYVGPSGGVISFAAFASLYAPRDVCEFSVDGVPQVVIASFSDEWETHQVALDAGKHELKWKLIKNFAGLNTAVINDVDIPFDYEGYVKLDAFNFEDSSVPHHVVDENVMVAVADEVTEVLETSTTAAPIVTNGPVTTSATTTTKATTTSTSTTTEATTTSSSTTTTEEPTTTMGTTIEFVECPVDLIAVEGLPGCCVEEPSYLGDGACDPRAPYNTEACAFDLGDCCRETCNLDSAYGCKTKEGGDYGPFGFFCIDPRYSTIDEMRCQVENREWVGDGGCDAAGGYNTPECGWDGGDCCEDTCDNEFSFYPCGANQQYICQDPQVLNKPEKPEGQSPFAFHDGFESGVFDPLRWDVDDGDIEWQIENDQEAAEGEYYIIARSKDISSQLGTAKLKHGIQSLRGGILSFDIKALVQIPFDDVIVMIDDDVVAEFTTPNAEWQNQELEIPAGPHLVQWIHRKNPSNMSEGDLEFFGYPAEGITMIDNIAFDPS